MTVLSATPWVSVHLSQEIDGVSVSVSIQLQDSAFRHAPEAQQRLQRSESTAIEEQEAAREQILREARQLLDRAHQVGRSSLACLACEQILERLRRARRKRSTREKAPK